MFFYKTAQPQALTCRFRAATGSNGRVPEFWWPDSGRRSSCEDWKSLADGRTEVPVVLAPSGSVFVVFRKPDVALDPIARDSFVAAASPAPMLVEGPWHVAFPEGWGAPPEATFDKLQSWTESDNEGIRFFSGIATYRKSIEIPEPLAKQDRLFLELGDLAEIAEVTLNGKNLGRVWLPPYRVEISGVAQAGPNQLEIRIANLWANRFNADSLRPGPERFTRSNLDRIQTDPTSDSSFGQVPRGKTRPVYTELPPLMKSGLFANSSRRSAGAVQNRRAIGRMRISEPLPCQLLAQLGYRRVLQWTPGKRTSARRRRTGRLRSPGLAGHERFDVMQVGRWRELLLGEAESICRQERGRIPSVPSCEPRKDPQGNRLGSTTPPVSMNQRLARSLLILGRDHWTRRFLWFALLAWAQLGSLSLHSRPGGPHLLTPEGHAENKQRATEADQANLKRHASDPEILVLPGLVADRSRRRVEVMVERTRLAPESPCEFTVIAETSDHAYEALLVAFAKPSDVHRALQFIGIEPGAPFDPDGNRFWARGEPCVLRVAGTNQPPLRLEQLLLDRRTGKTLREEGFLFTGSLKTPAIGDSQAGVYAADEYQPKSIVSLFNSSHSVLQVPYVAPKSDVYQNTIINPEHELPEGVLLTLVLEPANPDGPQRVKDLSLRVRAGSPAPDRSLTGAARLNSLKLELKDGGTILNAKPNLLTVLETLARLDRKAHACFLTLEFDDDVEVGDAQALARVLASIDSEPGVRIEPPPRGQLYYKAFTPDTNLLNREERIYHPWELSLSEKMGRVQGTLVRIESVWKESSADPELKSTEVPVAGPAELHQALESEAERTRRTGSRPRPPVMMVFASRTLPYGALVDFLAPSLATHKAIHVYLDTPMPPLPTPPRTPNQYP